jgi:hypothetical protein
MNYNEQMQAIWRKYEKAGMPTPASARDVAAWAIEKGLWKPEPYDIVTKCAEDLAVALRAEYRTDKYGRRYRSKHAVRLIVSGKQFTLWADIDSAPRHHMEIAFGQRRRQIIADCHQLKTDVDCYNGAHPQDKPIQLVLDFTVDVQEIEVLGGEKAA